MTLESKTLNRNKIRVLIVDDSTFMRKVLRTILAVQPRIEVIGEARNGKEGLGAFEQLRPDLIMLDVEMPEMNGIQALSRIRRIDRKVPIIMCSTLTQSGMQTTIEALALGATDYVSKLGERGAANEKTTSLGQQLIPKILALFPEKPAVAVPAATHRPSLPFAPDLVIPGLQIVVIGISTGGPAALEVLLPQLPAHFPLPILIVQHMPIRFTELLANRLNRVCPMQVREAADGVRAEPGVIDIARGDWHLELTRDFRMHLQQNKPESFCRPSVDVLFRSAAAACHGRLLGVIMTGMGSDGLEGSRAIRAAGGAIFAQDTDSCVVWGMPGSVVNAGLANRVLALPAMAGEITRFVSTSLTSNPNPGARGHDHSRG